MNIPELNSLLDLFHQKADQVKEQAYTLLQTVSEGRVPTETALSAFNTDIADLRNQYNGIFTAAEELTIPEALPPLGSSVSALVDAAVDSQSRKVHEQVEYAKEILNQFIHVESMLAEYTEGLRPFQEKAAELLHQIDETNIHEILPETEAPETFLAALKMKNVSQTPDGIDLLMNIGKNYPPIVQLGLASGNYYLGSSSQNTDVPPAVSSSVEVEKQAPSLADSTSAEVANPAHPDAVSPDAPKKGGLSDTGEDTDVVPSGDNTIANTAIKPTNHPQKGSISASAFKKEITRLAKAQRDIQIIVPIFTNMGILTAHQLYLVCVCLDAFDETEKNLTQIETAVTLLVNKGYLLRFGYSFNGEDRVVYCLSNYCQACMRKESIIQLRNTQNKPFWCVSLGKYQVALDQGASLSVLEEALVLNEQLLQYLYTMRKLLNHDQYQKIVHSIRWNNTSYQILVPFEDQTFSCCLVSYPLAESADSLCSPNLLLVGDAVSLSDEILQRFDTVFVLDQEGLQCFKKPAAVPSLPPENFPDDPVPDEPTVSGIPTGTDPASQAAGDAQEVPDNTPISSAVEAAEQQPTVSAEGKASATESLSLQELPDAVDTPSDETFCRLILQILNQPAFTKDSLKSAVVNSVLLAYGAGLEKDRPKSLQLSQQLRFASGLMLEDLSYTSEKLMAAFAGGQSNTERNNALLLAAYISAIMLPTNPYDYGLRDQVHNFFDNYEVYFPDFPSFKPLFNKFIELGDISPVGFTPSIIASLGSQSESEAYLSKLRVQAKQYLTYQPPKTRIRALPILYNACFGAGSDLHTCMGIISKSSFDDSDIQYVELVLDAYCDKQGSTWLLNDAKLEQCLNDEWDNVNTKKKFRLEYDARELALRQFHIRIELMLSWIEHVNNISKKGNLSRLKSLKEDILKIISSLQKDMSFGKKPNTNILSWMLSSMQDYLSGQGNPFDTYSDLLYSGVISLNDDGTPWLDPKFADIRFYEPWRNVARHINTAKRPVDEIKADILGDTLDPSDDGNLKDNLHQLALLGLFLNSKDEDYIISEEQSKEATDSAEERTIRFRETLELSYTYNQINEAEKETLAGIMEQYKTAFFERMDFACWRQFLKALERQITVSASIRQSSLRKRLNTALASNAQSPLLQAADHLLETDRNFAVAEEYLTRFENGDQEFTGAFDPSLQDRDYFSEFLHSADSLFQACKRSTGSSLKNFGWAYIERHQPKDWTSRQREDSRNLLQCWPSRKGASSPEQICSLFRNLGLDVQNTKSNSDSKEDSFLLTVRPTPKGMPDYRHPIAAFGTQIKSPLHVVILYGNFTERQLIDTISSLNLRQLSIVLIDRPLDISYRRMVGEYFHTKTSMQNSFLLIDQVLFLYLAMQQETERLPALLKCTLPYTSYQPFVRDAGATADEMFFGRTKELSSIMDMGGACVVYGGRQLGKTALLERAENLFMKPDKKEFAVYTCIVRQKTEADVISTITSEIVRKTDGKIPLPACDSIKSLCLHLSKLFQSGRIAALLLLIDEADSFLAAIADNKYDQLQPFVNLRRETRNNFKFVLTGLHNVCRAKNATKDNGIFGQLGTPLCIKPLSPTDALQLLSRPLSYLGFQIDRYPHLETILANTNYYPGILQFFGYMLVETLNAQYSKYYHAADGNPPFTLQDDQLGAVMNSADLNRSIKEKFRWSLELDPRYFMIARCITVLYHLNTINDASSNWMGFKVFEIREIASLYDIRCLEHETEESFITLLDEMVEMGILSQPASHVYRLRRSMFVDIIGENFDALERDIESNAANPSKEADEA